MTKKKIIIISAVAAAVVLAAVALIIILGGAKTYTVTFLDHDGTPLAIREVKEGEDAEEPTHPQRSGYIFKGWSGSFKNVGEDLTLTATYEAITSPTLLVGGKEVGGGESFTLDIFIEGNVGITGLLFTLGYDSSALRLEGAEAGDALTGLDLTAPGSLASGCKFAFDGVDATAKNGKVLTLRFTAIGGAGGYPIEITVDEAYDGAVKPISFKTSGNTVIIK